MNDTPHWKETRAAQHAAVRAAQTQLAEQDRANRLGTRYRVEVKRPEELGWHTEPQLVFDTAQAAEITARHLAVSRQYRAVRTVEVTETEIARFEE